MQSVRDFDSQFAHQLLYQGITPIGNRRSSRNSVVRHDGWRDTGDVVRTGDPLIAENVQLVYSGRMDNYTFCNPTKIIFGKGTISEVGGQIHAFGGKKALLHYGGGSIRKTGIYDTVVDSLKAAGIEYVELPGVVPNPRLSLIREGMRIVKIGRAHV